MSEGTQAFIRPTDDLIKKLLERSNQCERFIREPERRLITGVSRSQWWSLEKEQIVPSRISLGGSSVAWRLSDLLAWIEQVGV